MTEKLAILAGTLALAIVPASCGGDDDASSGGPLTREEFIAEADAICLEGEQEVAEATEEQFPDGQPNPEEAVAFAQEVTIPSIQERLDKLRELQPPPEVAETFEAALQSTEDGLAEAAANPSALAGQTLAPFAQAQQLAGQVGLQECST